MAQDPEHVGQEEIEQQFQHKSPAAPAKPVPQAGREVLGQDEIEALLSKPGAATAPLSPATATPAAKAPAAPGASAARKAADLNAGFAAGDAEFLLQQAEAALASVDAPRGDKVPGLTPFRLAELSGAPASTEAATMELIRDVELDVRIELGRTQMHLEDVLRLRRGAVVPLDKLAGDPVDVFVNGRLIARGEVLVLNENFCVRVNELVASQPARAG